MKKLFIVLFSLFLLVGKVDAVTAEDTKIDLSDYQTLGFKEILEQEEIELTNKDYKETDDQAVIYLFRGNGCHYCQNFLNFLNSISTEYGSKFKVVGFEVWGDENNSKLLDKISSFMGDKAGGVPYIIIGDQVFPGFADTYGDAIKSAIDTVYDNKNEYDAFKEYNKAVDKAKRAAQGNTATIIIWNLVFVASATVLVVVRNNKQHKELMEEIKKLGNKTAVKETEVKEVKKNAKKK